MIEVVLGRVAHGGFVVARHAGKVVFVTGGLPGERVLVEVDEVGARFDRGHVAEVLEAAPGRVEPSCPVAGRCGGCDWQHASPATQLELKTAVVAEQLQRLTGIAWDGHVQSVPGGQTGWRTRVRYAREGDVVGFRARRSHEVVGLPEQGCELATPGVEVARLAGLDGSGEIKVTVADEGVTIMTEDQTLGPAVVRQRVLGRVFEVGAGGFWQVHPAAATVLTEAVLDGLAPRPGESALDLYCGVGLFAGALVDAGCAVTGLELSREAVRHARGNVPEARFLPVAIERATKELPRLADLVVLDPPRKGAGAKVVQAVAARRPRAIAYVACDPAALARDLGHFQSIGYRANSIKAYDLFPKTHHVECVAILTAHTP